MDDKKNNNEKNNEGGQKTGNNEKKRDGQNLNPNKNRQPQNNGNNNDNGKNNNRDNNRQRSGGDKNRQQNPQKQPAQNREKAGTGKEPEIQDTREIADSESYQEPQTDTPVADAENPEAPGAEKKFKPRIGLTIGDFNGIGPEIILKCLADLRVLKTFTPVVYGPSEVFAMYKDLLKIEKFQFCAAEETITDHKINLIECRKDGSEDGASWSPSPGIASSEAGLCALMALEKASEHLKNGLIDAVVTAPIDKGSMQGPGFKFKGHTDFFADKFGGKEALMMFVSEKMKVAVLTDHIPLSEVKKHLTAERLTYKIKALMDTLTNDFLIQKPRLAVLGVNPHAGEDGLLGSEEKEIMLPAIKALQQNGHLVFGPFPADGFFGTASFSKFDAVLAIYHDQGLIPFKTLAFDEGVNFTAGLPIVRSSPDHGTAYDIAGKGEASHNSMMAAIYLAVDVARNRHQKVDRTIRKKGGKTS